MEKLPLAALVGISILAVIMIPSVMASPIFYGFSNERECFETKEFIDRDEAEQEYERWQKALGHKMAGFNFNGLTDKSLTPTPLTVCVFPHR